MISGGNFHGAPLAYAFDYAALAMTDLAGITERRVDRLLNPDINEGLPAFLSTDPGLSSGFMIAQIVAAALINECQVLSHPSSTGSIPTDGGKEDHVSMGMTGALKLRQIVEHAERILAIELMCAAQALEFRRPLKSSAKDRGGARRGAQGRAAAGEGSRAGAGYRGIGAGDQGREAGWVAGVVAGRFCRFPTHDAIRPRHEWGTQILSSPKRAV